MGKSIENVIKELPIERQRKIEVRFQELLAEVRRLRQAKKHFGVDAIYFFVSDVDGDWLKDW